MGYDMANIYRKRKTDELRTLRSKKFVRLQKLEAEADTYFVRNERTILQHQIHQIDVELNSRFFQLGLPL